MIIDPMFDNADGKEKSLKFGACYKKKFKHVL